VSAPVVKPGDRIDGEEPRRGRRYGMASLLMVPALLAAYLPLYVIGSAVMALLGLEEGQLLTEAGPAGAVAAVLMVSLSAVPQLVGIWLGLRARRLGERRLGTAGVVVNALVGAFFVIAAVGNLAFG
jgi:hypothetical protein